MMTRLATTNITPASFTDSQSHNTDTYSITLPASYASSGGTSQLITDCWSLVNNDDDMVYFLLVIGQNLGSATLAYGVTPTLYVDRFTISCFPVNYSRRVTVADGATLIGHSPPTTNGETTYTSNINRTLSSTAGFSGSDAQGSITYSVSTDNSQTRTINDITVYDQSLQIQGNDGTWVYAVAENSNTQHSNLAICQQMLFKVPYSVASTDKFAFALRVSIDVSDHDGHDGTRYFDDFHRGAVGGVEAIGGTFNYAPGQDRIGTIQFGDHYLFPPVPTPVAGAKRYLADHGRGPQRQVGRDDLPRAGCGGVSHGGHDVNDVAVRSR